MNRPEAGSAAVRLVGAFFAATAAGNAVGTIRTATGFLEWMRDGAWLAPFPRLLRRLVPVAPAVVAAVVVFEAVLAYLLLRLRQVNAALRLAQLFVLALIPCIAWPYWVANLFLAAVFEAVRRAASSPPRDR